MHIMLRTANCRRGRTLVVGGVFLCVLYLYLFSGGPYEDPEAPPAVYAGYRYIPRPQGGSPPPLAGGVPRIIHQTWSTEHIPDLLRPWVQSWRDNHPDWEHWFWTDTDIRNLIKHRFPKYLSFFDSYPKPGYKIDAFRYFVLYEYGGVYADLDMENLKPLDDVISGQDCLVSQEPIEHAHFLSPISPPLVSNALMACRRGHPFFEHIISHLKHYAGFYEWNDVLRATGPLMLSEVYRGYHQTWFSASQPANPVVLAEPHTFHPTLDNSMLDDIKEMCLNSEGRPFLSRRYMVRQKELCKIILSHEFRNTVHPKAYTNHHWTHTWAGEINDPWGVHNTKNKFNIREIQYQGGKI